MDNDELKYSLRSIYKFAPWVDKIFIVTDNQKPEWLNLDHPKIRLVDHKDIFKDLSCLPSYSARGIESQIHNIKELSEHFIYFNDDMFLGSHSSTKDFFIRKGKPYIFVSEFLPIPKKKAIDITRREKHKLNDHQYAIVNTRNALRSKMNKTIYYNVRHGPKPLLKSVLKEIHFLFNKEIEKTVNNSFRTKDDILMFHLFSFYAIAKKIGKAQYMRTVSKKPFFLNSYLKRNNFTFGYINLHDENLMQNLTYIQNNNPLTICLNQTPSTPPANIEKIKSFLAEYFPEKCPFETS
jgi:hypothetical protein